MKVAVIGSRSFQNRKLLEETLDKIEGIELIVSGGAIGADTMAEAYAKARGIKTLIFRPEYDKYGRTAPLIRNKVIINNADMVIAFWDGKSRGTKFTVDYAKSLQLQVNQIIF